MDDDSSGSTMSALGNQSDLANMNTGNGETTPTAKQKMNYTYNAKDQSPYRVMVEILDSNNGELRINKLALAVTLHKMSAYKNNVVEVKQAGRNKMIVYLNNYEAANRLIDDDEFRRRNYRAYVPMHFISLSGVVAGVPLDVSIEELEESVCCEVPILGIRRLNTWIDGMPQPSQRISITFRASTLPRMVKMFRCTSKVRPFYKKSVLCMNCLRYSHRADNCRSKKRCVRCTMIHNEEEEFERCLEPVKCLYCRKDHTTTDRECPERKRQDNIQAIMAKTNLTYVEARERFPILTENYYEALVEMTDDPTPAESFATMTANQYTRRNQHRTNKEMKEKQPSRIISEQVTVFQEKRRKFDTSQSPDGIALFNKHKVSDAEKWKSELRAAAANNQSFSGFSGKDHPQVTKSTPTKTPASAVTDPANRGGAIPKSTILFRHTSGKVAHPNTMKK